MIALIQLVLAVLVASPQPQQHIQSYHQLPTVVRLRFIRGLHSEIVDREH
jgi:hypothetical protein